MHQQYDENQKGELDSLACLPFLPFDAEAQSVDAQKGYGKEPIKVRRVPVKIFKTRDRQADG